MRTIDLLDDSFPHGTPRGYADGCRGAACPAVISCRDVHRRYSGDWGFRKLVDAGLSSRRSSPRKPPTRPQRESGPARQLRESGRRRRSPHPSPPSAAHPRRRRGSPLVRPRRPNPLRPLFSPAAGASGHRHGARTGRSRVAGRRHLGAEGEAACRWTEPGGGRGVAAPGGRVRGRGRAAPGRSQPMEARAPDPPAGAQGGTAGARRRAHGTRRPPGTSPEAASSPHRCRGGRIASAAPARHLRRPRPWMRLRRVRRSRQAVPPRVDREPSAAADPARALKGASAGRAVAFPVVP